MADLRERLQEALAGRYRLERALGRGGMATVFLATDLKHMIYFTNHVAAVENFLAAQKPANVRAVYTDEAASVPSLRVDLGSLPFVG